MKIVNKDMESDNMVKRMDDKCGKYKWSSKNEEVGDDLKDEEKESVRERQQERRGGEEMMPCPNVKKYL